MNGRSRFSRGELHVSALGVIFRSGAAVALLWVVSPPHAWHRPHQLLLAPLIRLLEVAAILTVTSAIVVSSEPKDATDIAVQCTATVQQLENGTSFRIFVLPPYTIIS